jgi:hypothetical protein
MFICIRYNVNGQEFWDNNHGMNYQIDFVKSPKTVTKPSGGARPTLPRSRSFATSHSATSHSTRPRSMPLSFDDFPELDKNVPFSNPFASGKASPLNRTSSDDIDTIGPPKRRETQNRQGFSNRYDFGASLTAAMRAKTPLDRTTLSARARSEQTPETKSAAETPSSKASAVSGQARKEDLKPSSLVSSKPCLESSVYKELVDKYCFVSLDLFFFDDHKRLTRLAVRFPEVERESPESCRERERERPGAAQAIRLGCSLASSVPSVSGHSGSTN